MTHGPAVPEYYGAMRLTSGDHIAIDHLLSDTYWPVAVRLQHAMNYYINARLREIPEASRARYRAAMDEFINGIRTSPDGRYEANAHSLTIPEDLRSTATAYVTIAHELEHRIQIRDTLGEKPNIGQSLALIGRVLFSAPDMYRTEYGAMRAEWEFLKSIPPDLVDESIRRIQTSIKDPQLRGMLTRRLQNVHLPFERYIEGEHRASRYSMGQATLITTQRITVAAGFALLALTGANAALCIATAPGPYHDLICGASAP